MTRRAAKELGARFENAEPQEILDWAITTYRPSVALSSSFGVESAGLLHMATRIDPDIPVLFLNTGFHFEETLRFVAELTKLLDLNLREFKATPDLEEGTRFRLRARGIGTGTCCADVKVPLMRESLKGLDCWIAGLRRDQSDSRRHVRIVEPYGTGLTKVHPLANWSTERLHDYLRENNLPFHPLWYLGYTSIGCEPCTSLPVQGLSGRSGRWTGTGKTECGIHTFLPQK